MNNKLISTAEFEQIISQENLGYTVFDIDLSIPRNEVEFSFHGNIFQVNEMSDGANFFVKFNNKGNSTIKVENFSNIEGLYYRFFISNEAQPNKRAKIFCGNRYKYTPAWKVEGNFNSQELSQKLTDVVNALNNMETTLTYNEVVNKLNDVITAINNIGNNQNVVNAINNLENTLTYDEVVNKLNDVITAINNIFNNVYSINSLMRAVAKTTNLTVKTLNLSGNTTLEILPEISTGRLFGIVNHSETLSIFIQFGNDTNNTIELVPFSTFEQQCSPSVIDKIILINNNSQPVKISYWSKITYS